MTFEQRIIHLIEGLNAAWQRQDWHAVGACYHPDAVLLPPDAGAPIVGRSAVLASYQEFAAAQLLEFTATDFEVFEFGDHGVCHMRFSVEYRLGETQHKERGLEVYMVAQVPEVPQIIWRSQSVVEIQALDSAF